MQPNNRSFTANGSAGVPGVNTFTDDYCFANQIAARPPSMPPQDRLGNTLVDYATQYYNVGSTQLNTGVTVQAQTLQRFQDHPTVVGITSPIR